MTPKALKTDENEIISNSGDRIYKTVINSSKNLIHIPIIEAIEEFIFLIFNIKKILNYLKQAFIKVPILQHFDLKSHIWIATDI